MNVSVMFYRTATISIKWTPLVMDTKWLCGYRYQKKCDQLEVSNGEFRDKFEQLEDSKKDIVAFIKKKLDEKGFSVFIYILLYVL